MGLLSGDRHYAPVGRIIKLLPLANDKDNVDNLTTGSAAKFTLASNAVRDLDLLAMLKCGGQEPAEGCRCRSSTT